MSNARGIDISDNNDWVSRTLLRDWKTRYPGMCYGVVRSTIGTRTDLLVRQHRDDLLAEGYLTGLYHALHEADPIQEQITKFVSFLDERDSLPAWLDVERAGLKETLVEHACDVYDNLTMWPLWIYTSKTTFEKIIKLNFGRYAKYGLVTADYGPGLLTSQPWPTPPGRPLIPKPWIFQAPPHYEMWQYAGDNGRLFGSTNGIDQSIYDGTEAEFRLRFAKESVPVEDPDTMAIAFHAEAILEIV